MTFFTINQDTHFVSFTRVLLFIITVFYYFIIYSRNVLLFILTCILTLFINFSHISFFFVLHWGFLLYVRFFLCVFTIIFLSFFSMY